MIRLTIFSNDLRRRGLWLLVKKLTHGAEWLRRFLQNRINRLRFLYVRMGGKVAR